MTKKFNLATFREALTPDVVSGQEEFMASDVWYNNNNKRPPFIAGHHQIFSKPLREFQKHAKPDNFSTPSSTSTELSSCKTRKSSRKSTPSPIIEEITDSTDYEDASDVWLSESKGESDFECCTQDKVKLRKKRTVKIDEKVDQIVISESDSERTVCTSRPRVPTKGVWMVFDNVGTTTSTSVNTSTSGSETDIAISFFDEPVTIQFHDHETMKVNEVLLYSEKAMKKVTKENEPATRLKVLKTLHKNSKCYKVKGLRGVLNKQGCHKALKKLSDNSSLESCHNLEKCLNTIYIPRSKLVSFTISSEAPTGEHDKIQYLVTSGFTRMFKKFARYGDGTGIVITPSRSNDWLEKSGVHQLLDAEFTKEQFRVHSGVKVVLGIYDYVHYIVRMAIQKAVSSREIINKMCNCPLPPKKVLNRMKRSSLENDRPRNAWSQVMHHFINV